MRQRLLFIPPTKVVKPVDAPAEPSSAISGVVTGLRRRVENDRFEDQGQVNDRLNRVRAGAGDGEGDRVLAGVGVGGVDRLTQCAVGYVADTIVGVRGGVDGEGSGDRCGVSGRR